MPNRAEPLNNLGLTLEAGGRLPESIQQFSSAVELAPNNPEYLGNLIRARLKNGEHVEFLRMELEWLQFIERRPDWLEWTQDQLILGSRRGMDRSEEQEEDGPEVVPRPPIPERPPSVPGRAPLIPERAPSIPPGAPPESIQDAPQPSPLPSPIQPLLDAPENAPLDGVPAPIMTVPDR